MIQTPFDIATLWTLSPGDFDNKAKLLSEWQAQNKLDTLFFLQLTFLYLTLVVALTYFRHTGLVPSTTYYIINGIFLIILVFTLWNRASYTERSRDKRYWNRRFIGLDDAAGGLTAKLQCGVSNS
jgi:hypothetical protein